MSLFLTLEPPKTYSSSSTPYSTVPTSPNAPKPLPIATDGWEVRWEDIKVIKKIGEGVWNIYVTFLGASGIVQLAEWKGQQVAVKKLKTQALESTLMKEFLLEASIMK